MIDPAGQVADEAYAAGYRDGRGETPAGLTISEDGALLNWLGVNYVRQGDADDAHAACGSNITKARAGGSDA